jgi:hypothetical protein
MKQPHDTKISLQVLERNHHVGVITADKEFDWEKFRHYLRNEGLRCIIKTGIYVTCRGPQRPPQASSVADSRTRSGATSEASATNRLQGVESHETSEASLVRVQVPRDARGRPSTLAAPLAPLGPASCASKQFPGVERRRSGNRDPPDSYQR